MKSNRLVIIIPYTDDCTYFYEETTPIVIDASKEEVISAIETAQCELLEADVSQSRHFWSKDVTISETKICSYSDLWHDEDIQHIEVFTVDEWFLK